MEQNIAPNTFALQVDAGNIPYLTEAAKWAKFLAIIGFIFCVLIALFGIFAGSILSGFMGQASSSFGSEASGLAAMGTGVLAAIYIIIAVIYLIPCIFLFNFASKMQTALRNNDQVNLNTSFRNLKSCFKFWGIMLIIVLCFYAIIITVALLGSGLGQ